MKPVFVLLTIAVTYACGATINHLKEMKFEVDTLLKSLTADELDTIFVTEFEANRNECKAEFFCQAEKVLSENEKVSQLHNEHKRGLIRKLKSYNQQHVKICTVEKTGNEITLHLFLQHIAKCIQKTIIKQKGI